MNSKKHKNKKVNRQPILNNPQKDDAKIEDVIDTQVRCIENEIKDECVQPTTIEVIKKVEEQKETEITAPKKPKRNKGKKKKQDKEDEYENDQEDKTIKADNLDIKETENVNQDLPKVIPVARKKKNKKKGELGDDKTLLSEHRPGGIQLDEEVKNESKNVETNTDLAKIEIIDEAKIAKKKNKNKKHRTDSEKSDKNEGMALCTSAFQKLLNANEDVRPNHEIKEPDSEKIFKDKSKTLDIAEAIIETKIEEKSQNLEEITPIIEHEIPIEDAHKRETLQCSETKSKKKNKKEKIPLSKVHLDENTHSDSQKNLIAEASEIVLEDDDIKGDSVDTCVCTSIKEDSLMPKAKIAKPVKKNGKEIQEFQVESSTDQISLCAPENKISFVEEIFKTKVFQAHVLQEKTKSDNIEPDKNQDTFIQAEQSVTVAPDISDNLKIKTKKKSPKISDGAKTKIDQIANLLEDIKLTKIEASPNADKDEVIFETLVPSDFGSKSSEDKLNDILSTITEPSDNDNNKKLVTEDSNQLLDNNVKSRKKGRKMPKICINPKASAETIGIAEKPENLKPSEDDNKYSILTPSDDKIEIRSVKADESECSTCDVTPEILYPRSISERLIDDNNNTVIQEVFEDTLNIPIFPQNIPLIQGSGETPTEIPEVVSSGIKLVEIETIFSKAEEKTDIKSKMMEVNKDMEELRLSIEKSLAELTDLKKSDEISEKKIQDKNYIKIDNIDILKKNDITSQNKESDDTVLNTIKSQKELTLLEAKVSVESQKTCTEEHDIQKSSIKSEDRLNVKDVNEVNIKVNETKLDQDQTNQETTESLIDDTTPPICPVRRDHKKGKKSKSRHEDSQPTNTSQSNSSGISTQDTDKEEKSEQKSETTKEEYKQQSCTQKSDNTMAPEQENHPTTNVETDYEPIENFEDALTSSADDINKTFEIIVNQMTEDSQLELASHKPEINIIAPAEDTNKEDVKENPVTPPKNLLGHPDIPVRSNNTDYKKEKNKTPNTKQAKVKIKDNVEIENNKESKESQTEKKYEDMRQKKIKNEESFCQISNCDDFIYKYSFRRVFLQSACHVCKKELIQFRVPCKFCSLIFYCNLKHKDEDWSYHQALCFAVSTIMHIKDQKYIYAEAKNLTGNNYRLLRMQTILSCEKVLKRRLVPWEQEVLLYPRMCAEVTCREWRQSKLKDCEGCGQISYCSAHADHLPNSHQRWCKSYSLYEKLVTYQQTKGRLEPKLPSRVLKEYQMPEKINEVLASMFEQKIDLNDVQYAALTQIATAPLTVALCYQIYRSKASSKTNDMNKVPALTIHVVGAELQFEADVLNKWEIFFLHVRPNVKELRVVMISPDLNPGKLPLDLLGRIRLCDNCRQNKRRVVFSFQDKKTYQEYMNGDEFIYPDIVCAFNPSLHRASVYNGKDPWPSTITAVMRLKTPFIITAHTITELHRDLIRVKECSELKVVEEPRPNPFSSVRPDRNFISDDEVPLLFKNQCFMILTGF